MKLALASLAAVLAAPLAFAQGNIELSGGYTQFDTGGAELGALTGRGTYFFNQYLGAEGEVSIGIDDANVGPGHGRARQLPWRIRCGARSDHGAV